MREKGFEVFSYQSVPEPEVVGKDIFMFSFDALPEPKDFANLRESYKAAGLVCCYNERSVARYHAIAIKAKEYDVKFLRPGIGIESMLEYLDIWFTDQIILSKPVIGVFASIPGAGATTVAALIARQIGGILLGLNVFNPGWTKPALTLDEIRIRLSQKKFTLHDLKKSAVDLSGTIYLPGNTDPLIAMDFSEDEIEFLLDSVSSEKTVVADFGAIPYSAAWSVGLQRSSIRIMVAHPNHELQLKRLMQLSSDLGVEPRHWFLLGNKLRGDDLPIQTMARSIGMQTLPLAGLSWRDPENHFFLPLNKKEHELLQRTVSLFEQE